MPEHPAGKVFRNINFFYKVDPFLNQNVWYFQVNGPEAEEAADLIEKLLRNHYSQLQHEQDKENG